MSTVSKEDIAHLAALSRLTLTEEEQERFAGQLSHVVSYVDQLQQVDTSTVASAAGVTGLTNIYQADQPHADNVQIVDIEKALAAAPRRKGKYIQVKAVLSGEAGAA